MTITTNIEDVTFPEDQTSKVITLINDSDHYKVYMNQVFLDKDLSLNEKDRTVIGGKPIAFIEKGKLGSADNPSNEQNLQYNLLKTYLF